MGVAFFVAGVSFLVAGLRDSRWQYYLAAGGLFGLAANFRMYFMMSLRIVLIVLFVAALIWALKTKSWKRVLGPALALALFLAFLLPWSLYKRKHEGTTNWSTASPNYSYGRLWDPREGAKSNGRMRRMHSASPIPFNANMSWPTKTRFGAWI
jgi:4-amino-4-deoxy-L-arabinose transferase-like glycosyltransferase